MTLPIEISILASIIADRECPELDGSKGSTSSLLIGATIGGVESTVSLNVTFQSKKFRNLYATGVVSLGGLLVLEFGLIATLTRLS